MTTADLAVKELSRPRLPVVQGDEWPAVPTLLGNVTPTSSLPAKASSHRIDIDCNLADAPGTPKDSEADAPACTSRKQAVRGTISSMRCLMKAGGLGLLVVIFFIAFFNAPTYVIEDSASHRHILTALFVTGITLVALEDVVRLDKSAVMLVLASVMWTFHAVSFHPTVSHEGHETLARELEKGLADVGSIVLFLLPAMGIVESIDHFNGFSVVTAAILRRTGENKSDRLLPIICLLSFFLSSVIDNLTATIVALKILKRVVPHNQDWRHSCGGLAVVAANAGGAWSPIGDVTTTMLWIQGKITSTATVTWLFFPSFVAGVVPLAGIWMQAKRCAPQASPEEEMKRKASSATLGQAEVSRKSIYALLIGVICILMVPVVKMVTGLPPYLGMLLALGTFWIITDFFEISSPEAGHDKQEGHEHKSGVPEALHKVDLSSLLFFTGVLLAVVALDCAGVLKRYAAFLVEITGGSNVVLCALLGVSSAVVDNVPLVQASIEMFDKPVDDPLWQLVALGAGTGGSILAVGSVAGVTLMGLEGVGFLWYCKRISLWAALGFALGIATYQFERFMAEQMGLV